MEEELKAVHCCLKIKEETIDKLRVNLSEKETEISRIQKELETTSVELQKKVSEDDSTIREYLQGLSGLYAMFGLVGGSPVKAFRD